MLNKDRLRDLHRIDKVLEMAIPKIKQKFDDHDFQQKVTQHQCRKIRKLNRTGATSITKPKIFRIGKF